MTSHLKLNGDSFVWTKVGLLKIKELRKDDVVLGTDRKGQCVWERIPKKPRLLSEKLETSHLFTDFTEVTIPIMERLCLISGETKCVCEIRKGEQLEILSNPKYILDNWEYSDVTRRETDLSYLAGLMVRRSKFIEDKLVIKCTRVAFDSVKHNVVEKLKALLQNSLKKNYDLTTEQTARWGWFIIKPFIFTREEIRRYDLMSQVPLFVRRSPHMAASFIKGFLEISNEGSIRKPKIRTRIEEEELRRFLYNMSYVLGLNIKANFYPTYFPREVIFKMDTKGLTSPFRTEKPIGAYSSKVRSITLQKRVCYELKLPIPWSPIVDLAFIP